MCIGGIRYFLPRTIPLMRFFRPSHEQTKRSPITSAELLEYLRCCYSTWRQIVHSLLCETFSRGIACDRSMADETPGTMSKRIIGARCLLPLASFR